MKPLVAFFCSILLLAMSQPAAGDDIAAERARLANQRIQAEEERRAREEERLEEMRLRAESNPPAEPAVVDTTGRVEENEAPPSDPVTRVTKDATNPAPAGRIEMSRALEQLRELGSLRDAGYLTDEEFQLLKNKILDGAL